MAHPGGRPTDYKPQYAEKAYKLCLLGAKDKELADFFEVSEQTLNVWKEKHPEFIESIKAGKEDADANVANSLYKKAQGYTRQVKNEEGEVIGETYYPPDTSACIFWLKNRQKHKWRDKQDIEHSGDKDNPIVTRIERVIIDSGNKT